jgi:hypothetical protein
VRVVVPVEHVLSHCCNMSGTIKNMREGVVVLRALVVFVCVHLRYFLYCSGSASCLTLVSRRGGCCFSSFYDFFFVFLLCCLVCLKQLHFYV